MNRLFLLLSVLLLLSCKSSEEFTGFSYDPEDVTNTVDKEINFQYRRVIGAGNPTVWISNKFEGARFNDFYAINDTLFEILIEPENAPINNSPWYAFKVWSDSARTATFRLNYNNGRHRYVPKISIEDTIRAIDSSKLRYDSVNQIMDFSIKLDQEPKTISAQLITDSEYYSEWLSSFSGLDFVTISDVGFTHRDNPIKKMVVSEIPNNEEAGVLIIIGRQHPPEVPGYLASQIFIEELTGSSELAKEFRKKFEIIAFPLLNVDGVLNGHWRHNAAGIDLNRDWENFNQPETQTVKNELLPLLNNSNRTVYYGIDFHSTNENIFYPIEESVKTVPDNLTQRWIPIIESENPNVPFNTEEFDTNSPIAKNWIYKTFGADAVTFEIDDNLDSKAINQVSKSAVRSLMKLLLEEKK